MVYYQKRSTVNEINYDDVYQVDLADGSEKKLEDLSGQITLSP